jgi:hypothetical protein
MSATRATIKITVLTGPASTRKRLWVKVILDAVQAGELAEADVDLCRRRPRAA